MKIRFTERMKGIISLVEPTDVIADIGADHGLMSIHLIKENMAKKVYACDINPLPLEKAKRNIEKCGLQQKIIPLLTDGLKDVYDKASTVLIAGLGGEVISEIIKGEDISGIKTFILQPMSRADKLRETLVERGLFIEKEILVKDAKKVYVVIRAKKGMANYSPLELLVGPSIMKEKGELFIEHVEKIMRYEKSKINGENGEKHRLIFDELEKILK